MSAKHVMVVDDDTAIRDIVTKLLAPLGLTVVPVESGNACLAQLHAGFRGLILMDVYMPEMNGWETIEAMVDQGLYEGNLVIMCTGLQVPAPRMETLKAYVVDYITKPFDVTEFVGVVDMYTSCLQ